VGYAPVAEARGAHERGAERVPPKKKVAKKAAPKAAKKTAKKAAKKK